jgi:uncharacterized membrane protein HdeD (DUF308 family)
MLVLIGRRWWLIALRGLCGVLFALAALAWPKTTLVTLVWMFGAYAIVDGALAFFAAARSRGDQGALPLFIVEGIIGVLVGIGTWTWPAATLLAIVYFLAGWAIVTGLLEIVAALRLRREVEREWLLGAAGVSSIAFGILMLMQPGVSVVALLWLLAGYTFVFGLLLIGLALSVRSLAAQQLSTAHG